MIETIALPINEEALEKMAKQTRVIVKDPTEKLRIPEESEDIVSPEELLDYLLDLQKRGETIEVSINGETLRLELEDDVIMLIIESPPYPEKPKATKQEYVHSSEQVCGLFHSHIERENSRLEPRIDIDNKEMHTYFARICLGGHMILKYIEQSSPLSEDETDYVKWQILMHLNFLWLTKESMKQNRSGNNTEQVSNNVAFLRCSIIGCFVNSLIQNKEEVRQELDSYQQLLPDISFVKESFDGLRKGIETEANIQHKILEAIHNGRKVYNKLDISRRDIKDDALHGVDISLQLDGNEVLIDVKSLDLGQCVGFYYDKKRGTWVTFRNGSKEFVDIETNNYCSIPKNLITYARSTGKPCVSIRMNPFDENFLGQFINTVEITAKEWCEEKK